MTVKVTLVLLLAVMVGSAAASAQPALARDVRVRVLAPAFSEKRPVGHLAAMDSTGLRLVQGRADTLFIPRDAVMAVDVSAGRRSHWVRGAAIGGMSGLVLATVMWIADRAENDDRFSDVLDDAFFPMVAVMLGGTGALVGGIIGAVARTEEWDRVPASDLRWTVAPVAGGARVGLSLRF